MGLKSNCVICEIVIQLSKSNCDYEKLRNRNCEKLRKIAIFSQRSLEQWNDSIGIRLETQIGPFNFKDIVQSIIIYSFIFTVKIKDV